MLHLGLGGRIMNCWGHSMEVFEIKGGLFPSTPLHPVSSSESENITHCIVVKFLCSFNFSSSSLLQFPDFLDFAHLNELPLKSRWASLFPPRDVLFKRRATLTLRFYSLQYKPQLLKSQRSFVVVLGGWHQYYCFAFQLFWINPAASWQKKKIN